MRQDKEGEVILESRLDNWYVRVGARRAGNEALVSHLKEVSFNDNGEKVLNAEYTGDVEDALCEVAGMNGILSAPLMISPFIALKHLRALRQTGE